MSITTELLQGELGDEPLITFPWHNEADRIINWSKERDATSKAFAFDLLMSLSYIDTIENKAKHLTYYDSLFEDYHLHLGFINLCAPIYIREQRWIHQKAAKPQSGSIGKLTSEVILRFLKILYPQFTEVKSIGGSGIADAYLKHSDGRVIIAEIKASPLMTFPFLFKGDRIRANVNPKNLSTTQIQQLESCLYTHGDECIPLGKLRDDLWPFRAVADFICDTSNATAVESIVQRWDEIRNAYRNRDRSNPYFYVANASGTPPKIARDRDNWPTGESISDSKTSAGLDRTDDIKKGIYQTFKMSVESARHFPDIDLKTALITNLPAYRHGVDYIEPFYDVMWLFEGSLIEEKKADDDKGESTYSCTSNDLKRPFDYIIALDDAFLRGDVFDGS